MRQIPRYLKNHQDVVDAFGYWPGFHDSPVVRFVVLPETIEMEVEAWETTAESDATGHLILTKKHEIGFRFTGIAGAELADFIPANILYDLAFSTKEDYQTKGEFAVELDSAMGSDLRKISRPCRGGHLCAAFSGQGVNLHGDGL